MTSIANFFIHDRFAGLMSFLEFQDDRAVNNREQKAYDVIA